MNELQYNPKALSLIAQAIGVAVEELGEVPSGHIYAVLMNKLDLPTYQAALDMLKDAGKIEETDSHLLKWKR